MKKIKITLFDGGYCLHPEKMVLKSESLKTGSFPAIFVLIEHEIYGNILFDTGYSEHFFEATKAFPYSLYAKTTPVKYKKEDSARLKLKNKGISPESVNYIIISHFHADHIAGLRDFPNAKFICLKKAYTHVKKKKGFAALRAGFLPSLIPDDFEKRVEYIEEKNIVNLEEKFHPFKLANDVFGDRSLLAIELSGHAEGQFGLLLEKEENEYDFLIADACWRSKSYKECLYPHPIANLIMSNVSEYKKNLQKIHQLYKNNPKVRIIPSHCDKVWEEWVEK